jgi:hypothetical protein
MKHTGSYKTLSVLGTSFLLVALLGGCASTDSVTQAQATADEGVRKANEANASAKAAKSDAALASQKADQANATANESKSTADAAKAESAKAMQEVNALAEKIDRMFKKTMQK